MKKNLIALLIILLSITKISNAQNYVPNYLQTENAFISNNFIVQDSSGWFMRNQTSAISPVNFLANYKQHFGMGADDGFILKRTTNDDYPFMTAENKQTHERYNQTYKGVPVEYAEFFIHHKNNKVQTINCKVAEGLNMSVVPTISEAQALTAAINYLGATNQYTWLDTAYENYYKTQLNNPNATSLPIGELVIAKKNVSPNYSITDFELAYKFRLISIIPKIDKDVYVSAINGTILKKIENIHKDGPAQLMYNYGNLTIDTKHRGAPYWDNILKTDANGRNIETKYKGNGNAFGFWNVIDDGDDTWDWNEFFGTTTHWCATNAWDYFKQGFNREGCKGNGRNLQVVANSSEQNAFYNNDIIGADRLEIGYDGTAYLGTIDVIGHEFTHGVTRFTAELLYEKEPGALNESFSDIFGAMVERHTQNGQILDWLCGEDAITIRSMEDPPLFNQPAFYLQPAIWADVINCVPDCDDLSPTYNDCCGVHTNSGVQNYWFYLLSRGSLNTVQGTFNNISVDGIGEVSAARIAYSNLDNYLGQNSVYNDAAWGAMFASVNIFGFCSNEHIQTKNAWAAVGVGNPVLPLSISGPAIITYTPLGGALGLPITYTANGSFPPYTWAVPNPVWSYNITGTDNNTLLLNNLNNNYTSTTIQVNSQCAAATLKIIPRCYGCYELGDNTTLGTIVIAPNPASTYLSLTVNFENQEDENPWHIGILNLVGTPFFQQVYPTNLPDEINISNLANGEYILWVQKGTNYQTIKFIKE